MHRVVLPLRCWNHAAGWTKLFAEVMEAYLHGVSTRVERDRHHAGPSAAPGEHMLRKAAQAILAFTAFPQPHWRKIWSTNPLERVNMRSSAAPTSSASSPTQSALLRLARAILAETHDEWAVTDRRYLSEGSMVTLTATAIETPVATPDGLTA